MATDLHSEAGGIHPGAFIQSADPGSCQPKTLWIDTTSGFFLKKRNAGDTAWDDIADLVQISAFIKTLLDDADGVAARATLGLVIGTNVQAFHANLAALAGLTLAADTLPYGNGAGTLALTDLTSFARTLLDDANAAAALATLGAAALASPTFTGTPAAPTAAANTNTTQIATTAYVQGELTELLNGVSSSFDTLAEIATELALKAPLASPVFTGNPTAPTPSAGDNDTSLATTAFVNTHVTDARKHARVRRTTTLNLVTAALTIILFDTDDADASDWHDTGSNTDRIVVDATGVYAFFLRFVTSGWTGNFLLEPSIMVNGNTGAQAFAFDDRISLNDPQANTWSGLIPLTAGDYVTFGIAHINSVDCTLATNCIAILVRVA